MSEIDVHIDGAASQLDGLVGDLCAAIAFNTKGPWALNVTLGSLSASVTFLKLSHRMANL